MTLSRESIALTESDEEVEDHNLFPLEHFQPCDENTKVRSST